MFFASSRPAPHNCTPRALGLVRGKELDKDDNLRVKSKQIKALDTLSEKKTQRSFKKGWWSLFLEKFRFILELQIQPICDLKLTIFHNQNNKLIISNITNEKIQQKSDNTQLLIIFNKNQTLYAIHAVKI